MQNTKFVNNKSNSLDPISVSFDINPLENGALGVETNVVENTNFNNNGTNGKEINFNSNNNLINTVCKAPNKKPDEIELRSNFVNTTEKDLQNFFQFLIFLLFNFPNFRIFNILILNL